MRSRALATVAAVSTQRPALGGHPQGATGHGHPHKGHVATRISQTKTAGDEAGIGTRNTWFQRLRCSQRPCLPAPTQSDSSVPGDQPRPQAHQHQEGESHPRLRPNATVSPAEQTRCSQEGRAARPQGPRVWAFVTPHRHKGLLPVHGPPMSPEAHGGRSMPADGHLGTRN